MRYWVANLMYRLRFPRGWLRGEDFRPHFDGYLLNACTPIPVGLEAAAVESILARRLQQSFRWMRLLRFVLRRGDRVQYCLGTLTPRRQYLKAWSSWEDLAEGIPPRDIAEYWR
ncbi:MAG: hypothetical protein JWN70_785 [Planctomycetaceae bacterium]|nr:hypothetical protein [Planctomycetaceae bacterium]